MNALLTLVPAYDFDLFTSGIQMMLTGDPVGGLIYALGAPVAADTALLTLFVLRRLRTEAPTASQAQVSA